MSQRSPIRFSVLVVAFAFLGACLVVLYHYRPVTPAIQAQPEPTINRVSVDNAEPTNQIAVTRPFHGNPKADSQDKAALPPAVTAPASNLQPDELYRALQESSDPQEKRKIRKQLASVKPGEVPFRFALEKYAGATTDEEKLHLQSIVSQIDVSGFTHEVASTASLTQDESLFVSLAYALRNSKSVLAKQELLQLAADNLLPAVRTNSLFSNQGLVALHRCLLDTLQPSDIAWINQYSATSPLNAVQLSIVADFMAKTNKP